MNEKKKNKKELIYKNKKKNKEKIKKNKKNCKKMNITLACFKKK